MRRPLAFVTLFAAAWAAASCDLVLKINLGYLDHASSTGGAGGAPACTPGEKRECYSGPDGTKGQGICKAGEQTCNGDGTAFGDCDGEQLPKPEDCATPVDDDCDGLAPTCEGLCQWSKAFGDDLPQAGSCIGTDTEGNALVAGTLFGSADFGGGPLVSGGKSDIFLAKLRAADGAHIWSRRFGDVDEQQAVSLVLTANNDVGLVGSFHGSVDFGGGELKSSGSGDVFVTRLSGVDGTHLWSKAFGDPANQNAAAGVIDPSGDFVVVGGFNGALDFGNGPLLSNGNGDIFVAKLAGKDGALLWSRAFGDSEYQGAAGVAVDGAGDVFIVGGFAGTIDFGGGPLTGQGNIDAFVTKLAGNDGSYLWSRTFGDSENQVATGATIDAKGNVVVVGQFGGTVDFGSGPISSQTANDIFIVKLAGSEGKGIWSRASFDADGDEILRSVATDQWDNLVLTGEFTGTLDFGGGPLTAIKSDIFVAKLAPDNGKHVWSKKFGKQGTEDANSVATDSSGAVFLTGSFEDVSFGCESLVAAGAGDAFVTKLSP